MRFDDRVEAMPNSSLTLMTPRPAQLHVMARQLGTGADQDRLGAPPHLDGVVGHQPVAADDEIERALALADAALAGDEHAEAEDVQQHRVQDGPLGEACPRESSSAWRSPSASPTARLEQRQPARARPRRPARCGGVNPPVMSTHGKSWRRAPDAARSSARRRRRGSRDSGFRSRRRSARGPASDTRGIRRAPGRSSGCAGW